MEMPWMESLSRELRSLASKDAGQWWRFLADHKWKVAATCIVGYGVVQLVRRPRNLPPGPGRLPIVGGMMHLTGDMSADFTKLGNKYGEVFSIYVGGQLTIIFNSYRAIKEAFVMRGDDFADRPPSIFMEIFNSHDAIFSAPYGEEWKKNKKFVMTGMRHFGFGTRRGEGCMQEEIEHLLSWLEAHNSQPLDIRDRAVCAAANVLTQIFLGQRYESEDAELHHLTDIVTRWLKTFTEDGMKWHFFITAFPTFIAKRLFGTASNLVTATNEAREFFLKKKKEHEQDFDPKNIRDVMDFFIKESRENPDCLADPEGSELYIVDTLFLMFTDGTLTKAELLVFWILYVGLNPRVQDKLHQEMDQVVGRLRKPCLDDKPALPYLEASIQEMYRLSNTVPLTAEHCALVDTTFDGYNIPRHAHIFAHMGAVHMDPEAWGDPEVYRPERFLDKDNKLDTAKTDMVMPFGTGKRMCPGEPLTRMDTFLLAANIIHTFSIEFPKDKPLPSMEYMDNPGAMNRRPMPFKACFIPRKH